MFGTTPENDEIYKIRNGVPKFGFLDHRFDSYILHQTCTKILPTTKILKYTYFGTEIPDSPWG